MAGKPGRSGRKRQGPEPKVYFNSRMDPALRDELQAAAKAAGRTLSAEIEARLKNSLVPAGRVDDATRALCLLIMEAAKETAVGERNWTNDAGLRYAFRRSVELIISMARTAGKGRVLAAIDQPFKHPIFKSPEELARATILRIGYELLEAKDGPQERVLRALGNPARWLQRQEKFWERFGEPGGNGFADYGLESVQSMLREVESWDKAPSLDPEGALLEALALLMKKKEHKS
jgi:hypothetical protein